jgi:hypothetical protein
MRTAVAAGLTTLLLAAGAAGADPGVLGGGVRALSPDGTEQSRTSSRERMPLAGSARMPDLSAVVASVEQAGRRPRGRTVSRRAQRRLGAEVRRRAVLRSRPGGKVVTRIGRRTPFGGPQILAVVERRGPWLGILHEDLPNGRAGWVHQRHVRMLRERWEIEIDRSERRAVVRRDGRVVQRFPVGIGRPESPTPLGRFGVTDRLVAGGTSPYGCCILALSGRQPNLPAGWTGGDRLALHGSPGDEVGGATSAGCLNVRERDLRKLMRRIPVGTRVDVVA